MGTFSHQANDDFFLGSGAASGAIRNGFCSATLYVYTVLVTPRSVRTLTGTNCIHSLACHSNILWSACWCPLALFLAPFLQVRVGYLPLLPAQVSQPSLSRQAWNRSACSSPFRNRSSSGHVLPPTLTENSWYVLKIFFMTK